MANALNFNLQFFSNISSTFDEINKNIKKTTENVNGIDASFSKFIALEGIVTGLGNMKSAIEGVVTPGANLNHNMMELSAITGVTGDKLKEIEGYARNTAKSFGIDASQQVESYKLILSKLGPEIAQNSQALKAMGDSVAMTSKLMGGDATQATEVLTTAMNQYGVDLSDPIQASKEMANMMNIMTAGAKVGSAELPQIKQGLEQVGMVAKDAKVSFSETNAALQVLDKAGKQGAEGGVALRNFLSTIGEGRFMAKQSREALEQYGISVDMLSDKNLTLKQRLDLLKPIMNDSALVSQVFGKENKAAAIALMNGAETIETYNKAIQNTNTAQEQSNIIMDSYQERMAKIKAKFDDLKISMFNIAEPFLPFAQGAIDSGIALGQMAQSGLAVSSTFSKIKEWSSAISFAPIITSFTSMWATLTATTATGATGISAIIANIPIIGWIAVAIAAIAALGYYLYNNSRKFNEIIGGIWAVTKMLFTGLWEFIKGFFTFLYDGFMMYIKVVQWVASTIFNAFKFAFEKIRSVAVWLWNGFKSIFGGVAGLVSQYIIAPISTAFDWIMGKVNAVLGWFKKMVKPLTDTFSAGAKAGGEAYDKRKNPKNDDPITPTNGSSVPGLNFAPKSAGSIAQDTIAKGKADSVTKGSSENSRPNNMNINVNKLVETLTIQTTNMGEGKEQLKAIVTETLLTLLNDANLLK